MFTYIYSLLGYENDNSIKLNDDNDDNNDIKNKLLRIQQKRSVKIIENSYMSIFWDELLVIEHILKCFFIKLVRSANRQVERITSSKASLISCT